MNINWQSWGLAVVVPLGAMALTISPVEPLPLSVVSAPTQLAAQGLYLRGTKIGGYTDDDAAFVAFANTVVANTVGGTPFSVDDGDDPNTGDQVEYAAGFRPFSHGGFGDLTYGASVAQGLERLTERVDREREGDPAAGIAPNADLIIVYGYSQSAVVVSQYKALGLDPEIVYILVSNPGRPNGGMLSRFQGFTIPVLDIPLSGPTPTSSAGWDGETPTTYDVARQYDGWGDFPQYPQNILATLNALLGMVYLHGSYEFEVPADALIAGAAGTDVRQHGDTVYYTIGTDLLPLLRPLEQIGVPRPLLLVFDAPLRVIVEKGYDRTASPGEESPAALRVPDPVGDLADVIEAIPVGIDDGLQASGLGRPLRTKPAGMYGVGGPVESDRQAQREVDEALEEDDVEEAVTSPLARRAARDDRRGGEQDRDEPDGQRDVRGADADARAGRHDSGVEK